ncbi:MAG: hypothetical protein MJZ11_12860 [Lachnospiraceae bacterium]|nr:hypothetical protein [Lachnospiraceae bacterium]
MDYQFFVGLGITIAGWGGTFGIMKQKVQQNEKMIEDLKKDVKEDISKIESKQTATDNLLLAINNNLTDLNTKVSLLLENKIKN